MFNELIMENHSIVCSRGCRKSGSLENWYVKTVPLKTGLRKTCPLRKLAPWNIVAPEIYLPLVLFLWYCVNLMVQVFWRDWFSGHQFLWDQIIGNTFFCSLSRIVWWKGYENEKHRGVREIQLLKQNYWFCIILIT